MFINFFDLKILDNGLLDKSKFFYPKKKTEKKAIIFFPDFGCILLQRVLLEMHLKTEL